MTRQKVTWHSKIVESGSVALDSEETKDEKIIEMRAFIQDFWV
jgi:hypothetical protein